MTVAVPSRRIMPAFSASAALRASGVLWLTVAGIGQIAFIWFIVSFYGPSTLTGRFEDWNRRDLITGHVPGDDAGNLQFAAHVLMAALITASGLIQLVPWVRTNVPALHRWNGRLYLVLVALMSLGGLWLVWGRGTYLTVTGAISISTLAVLSLAGAAMTLRTAMARQFVSHRRWALRTFLLANGVWFQRIGYMAWIILNAGPVGIGPRMDGPFDIALGLAIFLVPLAVLELYLIAERGRGPAAKWLMAGLLTALTGVTAVGIFGTVTIMWAGVL